MKPRALVAWRAYTLVQTVRDGREVAKQWVLEYGVFHCAPCGRDTSNLLILNEVEGVTVSTSALFLVGPSSGEEFLLSLSVTQDPLYQCCIDWLP